MKIEVENIEVRPRKRGRPANHAAAIDGANGIINEVFDSVLDAARAKFAAYVGAKHCNATVETELDDSQRKRFLRFRRKICNALKIESGNSSRVDRILIEESMEIRNSRKFYRY